MVNPGAPTGDHDHAFTARLLFSFMIRIVVEVEDGLNPTIVFVVDFCGGGINGEHTAGSVLVVGVSLLAGLTGLAGGCISGLVSSSWCVP